MKRLLRRIVRMREDFAQLAADDLTTSRERARLFALADSLERILPTIRKMDRLGLHNNEPAKNAPA